MVTLLNFHEVRLSTAVEEGAAGGPTFATMITTLARGDEVRNIVMAYELGKWQVGFGLLEEHQLNQLRNFYYARRGRFYGFRFRDLADYRAVESYVGTTDGATNIFQAQKRYVGTSHYYDRRLLKLVTGTISLYDDNVLTADYTVDVNTGLITLGGTLAGTVDHQLTLTTAFDVPVRFDSDRQDAQIRSHDIFDWRGVSIVEIKY